MDYYRNNNKVFKIFWLFTNGRQEFDPQRVKALHFRNAAKSKLAIPRVRASKHRKSKKIGYPTSKECSFHFRYGLVCVEGIATDQLKQTGFDNTRLSFSQACQEQTSSSC